MCHLDIKLEDALNDKSQSMFRHSELSNGGKQAKAPVDVAQRTTNVTLASSCPVCDRPSLYCNCKRAKQELDSSGNSSSGSDGSVTPPVYGLKRNSAGLNTILPVLRHLTIPIHDPSDDIDSDTPIYKSHEEVISDKSAVLGEFTNTSSEDLLNQIYSGFITDKKTPSSSPLLLKEADHQLAELSKDT
ncbi:uncharacterized protein EV154DRAFT_279959 [Mucor mucedo]|uniref:uncharacterized protein n=1 Tax=Mucor mucedo TaxID=29922 RepID=UPI00221E9075|nr:uncharacterized protein EV154DRAFT_279959 [Mucor mucedo]KAI7896074.1 hypothetical protein EV154DRAFT_279959 [Mucor mucedo]